MTATTAPASQRTTVPASHEKSLPQALVTCDWKTWSHQELQQYLSLWPLVCSPLGMANVCWVCAIILGFVADQLSESIEGKSPAPHRRQVQRP